MNHWTQLTLTPGAAGSLVLGDVLPQRTSRYLGLGVTRSLLETPAKVEPHRTDRAHHKPTPNSANAARSWAVLFPLGKKRFA